MTSFRQDISWEQEQTLLSANRQLLEMRAHRQAQREKIEKNNCVGLGREIGNGGLANIGKIVKSLVKDIRANLPSNSSDLIDVWREIGGKAIASATIRVEIRNGFVNVLMDNHILKNEIENFRKDGLLVEMRKRLPEKVIRGIRVKIGKKE